MSQSTEINSETKEKLGFYRISKNEYGLICDLLGRPPQGLEWPLFSALWSEHCSYKSSKVHLKKFYNKSPRVLEAFGENAGVVDLGEGERVAFKMESHNHPSYIEPYQGAATGVGGILRDIFTMGARPLAIGDYLCFGQPKADRMEHLIDGVVRGVGGYGNCVGVANVTGQTEFHSSYDGNILVNAFALGYFAPKSKVFLSKAKGIGNHLVYVGAKTGRDGVHGASMASESFDDNSEAKKPNVQIGDPFYEKCLIESCIEVMELDLVEAIQDMGAAGLSSSSFEMASKGQVGLKINLDLVPIRDSSITPEEILLSESQERMLLVCRPEKFKKLQEVFHRWDLDADVIGEVVEKREISLYWHGEEVAAIDPDFLVENAPQFERPYHAWSPLNRVSLEQVPIEKGSLNQVLKEQLSSINGCSKSWVYRQYDQRVGGNTAADCDQPVGVIQLPETRRPLGIVLGCRQHIMRFDAQIGGADAVYYPSLELASKGFEPLAVTDCLNFGNPEKPEVMSEFVAALEAMNETCKALETPVISGNVSLYNETFDKNVTSTPATGVVGLRETKAEDMPLPKSTFTSSGESIVLVSLPQITLQNYSQETKDKALEGFGELTAKELAVFAKKIREVVLAYSPTATRVVGKFGLPYTLAKMCLDGLGAEVTGGLPHHWSHEVLYEVLMTFPQETDLTKIEKSLPGYQVSLIGQTGGAVLTGLDDLKLPVGEIAELYKNGWRDNFNELA